MFFDTVNPNPEPPATPESASPAALAVQQHVKLLAAHLRGTDRTAEMTANEALMRQLIVGEMDA